jgi:signal transduction histidine kinase/DNA-binding response OmpR family regulator
MDHPQNQISILVIEDNPADQELLVENLQNTNLAIIDIKTAARLSDAITLLRQQSFSLIFLDFYLPDSSGMESFTVLSKENSKIPVIILSGLSDTELSLKAIALGAQDFLIKGDYTEQSLEKAVRYSIERKKNLEIIEENNERHNTISKATNDIIWDWNLITNKVLWTGQGLKSYISEDIAVKDIPDDFLINGLHPEERTNVIDSLDAVISSGGSTWQCDHRFLKNDGSYAYMNTRGYISVDDANKPVRIIGSMQDITQRKNAELELISAKMEAVEARKSQEQFLANMSHEIRTPMNGIMGMVQLIGGTNLSNEQKEYVETIKESASNLLVIINDILDFTKIVAGKVLIEHIDYNFRDIINNSIKIIHFKAEEKGILLTSEIDKRIHPVLTGDPVRLNQILINLVGNAIKFTEKGEVKVSVKLLEEDDENVKLQFAVSDTGIGIAPDKLNSVFDSFTQESSSTTRKYGGTGLGLTITKQLIELQGGTITVESRPGAGSTFTFCLPLKKSNTNILPSKSVANSKPAHVLSDVNILLVEDNLINQKVASYTLSKQGAQVEIANHGKEAIIMIEKKKYDVILMDIQMPEMDGFETTQYIRNNEKDWISKTPIIAMTASALVSERVKCLASGMNDYISKPFQAKELYDKISQQLN